MYIYIRGEQILPILIRYIHPILTSYRSCRPKLYNIVIKKKKKIFYCNKEKKNPNRSYFYTQMCGFPHEYSRCCPSPILSCR